MSEKKNIEDVYNLPEGSFQQHVKESQDAESYQRGPMTDIQKAIECLSKLFGWEALTVEEEDALRKLIEAAKELEKLYEQRNNGQIADFVEMAWRKVNHEK